jgi:uncharacterized protein (DUF58 family)
VNKLDFNQIKKYESLDFIAKQVVEGFITGLHKSPFHGFSVEFAEHRLYNTGESTKHIDWKLFGRSDKLFIKRYEEETNLRCQLVIDNSSSMYYPEDKKSMSKIEFSVYAAAALTQLLKKQRDAVGVSVFSDKLNKQIPAKSHPAHLKLIYATLEELLQTQTVPNQTMVVEALHQVAELVHKRSLIIIFSDMLDANSSNQQEIFSALQHLKHNKHEVILFHVLDNKTELEFEFENRPHTFIDKETGEEIKLNPSSIQQFYKETQLKRQKELKLKCAQYKIDFVEADINKGFDQILSAYLIKRNKMI